MRALLDTQPTLEQAGAHNFAQMWPDTRDQIPGRKPWDAKSAKSSSFGRFVDMSSTKRKSNPFIPGTFI